MSNSDEKTESGGKQSAGGRGALRALAGTLFVLAVVLLIAGFFGVRTESFRKMARERIEKETGIPVTIDRARIGWPYGLVLAGVRFANDPTQSLDRLRVDEVRIDVGIGKPPLVTLNGCSLTLVERKDGKWDPEGVSGLGELRDIAQIAGLTGGIRKKVRLRISHGAILWVDWNGHEVARAEDFSFTMEPVVTITGRKLHYCALSVRELALEDGALSRDVKAEWIITGEDRTVEIGYDRDDSLLRAKRGRRGHDEGAPEEEGDQSRK